MMQSSERKAVSQFPYPPRRYYHNCATDRPTPPVPPTSEGTYHMFGREYKMDDTPPTLEQAKKRQMYDPDREPTEALRDLNTHLLDLFMKLVDTLCTAPTAPADQGPYETLITRIDEVFYNMQHLINMMRHPQATLDLKALIDNQTKTRKQMADKLNETYSRAWNLISDAASNLTRPSAQLSGSCATPMHILANPVQALQSSAGNRSIDGLGGDDEDMDGDDINSDDDSDSFTSGGTPSQHSEQLLTQMAQIAAEPSL